MMSFSEEENLHREAVKRSKLYALMWQAVDVLFDLYDQGREHSGEYRFANGYAYEVQAKLNKEHRRKVCDRMTARGRAAARIDLRKMEMRC